jgi:mycoredoxin
MHAIPPHSLQPLTCTFRHGAASAGRMQAESIMKRLFKSSATVLLMCAIGAGGGIAAARGYLALQSSDRPAYIEGDYAEQRALAGGAVILLGTEWCSFCAKARDHLHARGIAFIDLDIETTVQAAQWMQALGAERVPVILVGDRQIRGFHPQAIDAAVAALDPALRAVAATAASGY